MAASAAASPPSAAGIWITSGRESRAARRAGKDIDFSGDFWDWTPPEAPVDFTPQPGGSPTSASSYYPPKMQKKRLEFPTAPAVEREVMLMERAP